MSSKLTQALNKLTRWRTVFAGWQLGTRADTDPECKAVRDHRESTIMHRAELSALLCLLVEKKVFTVEEWEQHLTVEAGLLDADYQAFFPGFRTTDTGLDINPSIAADTMSGWKP